MPRGTSGYPGNTPPKANNPIIGVVARIDRAGSIHKPGRAANASLGAVGQDRTSGNVLTPSLNKYRPKARHTHPQRKNFKARAKLTTLQISMLPSSQPSELKVAPSNMTLRMASIKGVSGRIRR